MTLSIGYFDPYIQEKKHHWTLVMELFLLVHENRQSKVQYGGRRKPEILVSASG
jgi:hypothetical protein